MSKPAGLKKLSFAESTPQLPQGLDTRDVAGISLFLKNDFTPSDFPIATREGEVNLFADEICKRNTRKHSQDEEVSKTLLELSNSTFITENRATIPVDPSHTPASNKRQSTSCSTTSLTSNREDDKVYEKKRRLSSFSGCDEDVKSQKREKNRIAAQKCRARKENAIERHETTIRDLKTQNSALEKVVSVLIQDLVDLRTVLGKHADCFAPR
eukprot:CFRG3328T1